MAKFSGLVVLCIIAVVGLSAYAGSPKRQEPKQHSFRLTAPPKSRQLVIPDHPAQADIENYDRDRTFDNLNKPQPAGILESLQQHVDDRLDKIVEDVTAIGAALDEKFAQVDKRLDAIEAKPKSALPPIDDTALAAVVEHVAEPAATSPCCSDCYCGDNCHCGFPGECLLAFYKSYGYGQLDVVQTEGTNKGKRHYGAEGKTHTLYRDKVKWLAPPKAASAPQRQMSSGCHGGNCGTVQGYGGRGGLFGLGVF